MAQQNLYNDDHRFLKWTIKDMKSFKTPLKCSLVVIITYLVLILLKLDSRLITEIYFFVVSLSGFDDAYDSFYLRSKSTDDQTTRSILDYFFNVFYNRAF